MHMPTLLTSCPAPALPLPPSGSPLKVAMLSTWPPTACGVATFARNSAAAWRLALPAGSRVDVLAVVQVRRGAWGLLLLPLLGAGARGELAARLPAFLRTVPAFHRRPQDAALDQHGNDSAVVAQVRKSSLWDYVQAAR